MRSATKLAQRLTRLIWSKCSTTFFLNGAPGSGKSRLLQRLAQRLDNRIPRSYVLGPYVVDQENSADLERRILEDCEKATFVDDQPDGGRALDLVEAWTWFADNAYVSTDHAFLVLVDLVDSKALDMASLGSMFSRARQLEGMWDHGEIRLFHMFVGYWDHPALERHFRDIGISFPYTPGDNYAIWEGVSPPEVAGLVRDSLGTDADSVYGSVLFELTDGHPAAALDVLGEVEPEAVTVRSLLSATQRAAESSPAGQALVDAWCRLPPSSREVLRELALQRYLPTRSLAGRWRQLAVAGAVRNQRVDTKQYVTFKSWYAELLARVNAEKLGIADRATRQIRTNQLMPAISELNVRAYRVINDIENQARNFVATRLSLRSTKGHILENRGWRLDEDTGNREDAYRRAMDWCQRSLDRGILNPLLAYLSTRDLARLIDEIGQEIGSAAWQDIANAIVEMSDIRDAVMHNQLIEGKDLTRLHELREDIYAALGEC